MKNLIKKILKEEEQGFLDSSEEDWEWAKDVKGNPFTENNITLVIDRVLTIEESEQIFQLLVDSGRASEEDNRRHKRAQSLVDYSGESNTDYAIMETNRGDGTFSYGSTIRRDDLDTPYRDILIYSELFD